ncbi:MAG: BrnA antitoxin family protein [Rhodospirillales bacterium]|nr:BrnA antitoxin family protein [Rhodospirillales bacterium]
MGDISPEEERRIDAGIAADPDNPELDAAFFARAKHGRGPQRAPTKQLVSLRLDPEVVEHFRATGPGWQRRMNEALRKAAGL